MTDDILTDEICLKRQKHAREDGWLCELVSEVYDDEPFTGIHSYIVSVNPGKSRANHYHKKKEEWIAITSGKIILSLEWIDEEKKEEEERKEKEEKNRGNDTGVNTGKNIEENVEKPGKKRADLLLDADDESGECRLIHIKPFVAHRITNISDRNSSVVVFSRNPEDKEDTIPHIIE